MKKAQIIIFILAVMTLTACRTAEPITQIEYRDSIRVVERIDSVLVKEKDSVFIFSKNDTIYLNHYVLRYKDRIQIQRDTVRLTNEVKAVEQVRYVPSYYKTIHLVFWILIAAIILYEILRIYMRV